MAGEAVRDHLSEMVRHSAEVFKDMNKVRTLIMKHAMHDYPEMDLLSLASGYPGISIFLDKLDEVYPEEGWDVLAFRYNQEIVRLAGSMPVHSLSLYSGLAGLIFMFNECSRGSTRYTHVLSQLLDVFFDSYPAFFEETRSKLEGGLLVDSDLDLISGWTGIAAVLMEVKEQQVHYSGRLVGALNQILQLITGAVGRLNNFEKLSGQSVYYNLGMAHGITGAINLLSVAKLRHYPINGLREVLEVAGAFLKGNIRQWHGTSVIPNMVIADPEAGNGHNPSYHRDAWCYGTPGASVALFRLGLALEDDLMQTMAVQLFNTVYLRPDGLRKVISPTICHGYAGLLLIHEHFRRAAGLEGGEEFLQRLLELRSAEDLLAFADIEGTAEKPVCLDKVGLLDGCAGVLLTLLTYDNKHLCTWEQMLLFS